MDLSSYPKSIQKAAYKTFTGLNGNPWKILVSYKKKSVDNILYIQDVLKNVYISGLFPSKTEEDVFYFDIRQTGQVFEIDFTDTKNIIITPLKTVTHSNANVLSREAVHA